MRKLLTIFRATSVVLACASWVLPTHELAAAQPSAVGVPATQIVDVRLDEHGALHGRLVDSTGQASADRTVLLQQAGGPPLAAQTDASGRFLLPRVAPGVHRAMAGQTAMVCRVWTLSAAPPSAVPEVLLAADPSVVRGQQPFSAIFTNPLFVGLVIAAAVAIPLAVHKSRGDRPSGS